MPVIKPLYRYIDTSQAKLKVLGGVLVVAALAFCTSQFWADPRPADLSKSPFALTRSVLAEWQDGDLIVFVRHLERCSRVDAACMQDEPTGITQRASVTGLEMRSQFAELGLNATDVYSSPLTRTSQTSELLFSEPTANKDFFISVQREFCAGCAGQENSWAQFSSCYP